jgi:polyhydroxybutyrate depolymerase
MRIVGAVFVILAASGCGAGTSGASDPLEDRTYIVKVPAGYDGSRPLPLVFAIHAYGASASVEESYFGLDPVADEQGFFVVYPNGTIDPAGNRFFSATDACCDFYSSGIDDVAFFAALLDKMEATYSIDPTRVYAVGHSNGAFMSHRLACDLSTRLAAVVSLEGAVWEDASRCEPTSPVAVVEAHGTDDAVILPQGGDVVDGYPNRTYPSVAQTMATWAARENCADTTQAGPDLGTIDSATSAPATVTEWVGCKDDVQLWTVVGGVHVPTLTPTWPQTLQRFLLAHSKAAPPPSVAPLVAGLGPRP